MNAGLRNSSCSIATAAASVTMATWMPRMRSAGRLMSTPSAVVTATASSGASGNGTPQSLDARASTNAQNPASVSWASETCPR